MLRWMGLGGSAPKEISEQSVCFYKNSIWISKSKWEFSRQFFAFFAGYSSMSPKLKMNFWKDLFSRKAEWPLFIVVGSYETLTIRFVIIFRHFGLFCFLPRPVNGETDFFDFLLLRKNLRKIKRGTEAATGWKLSVVNLCL